MLETVEKSALERETVLRRVSDAARFAATERARGEMLCSPSVAKAHSVAWNFINELMAVNHLTNYPYPVTAQHIVSMLRRWVFGESGYAVIERQAWPLALSTMGVIVPAKLLPMMNAFEASRASFTLSNPSDPCDAIEAAGSHAERVAAAPDIQTVMMFYGGAFSRAAHAAHLNGLLRDAGLVLSSAEIPALKISTKELYPGICDHTRPVRAIEAPDNKPHALLFEPYWTGSLDDAFPTTKTMDRWMGKGYGCAGLPSSESIYAGGGRCCIILLARRDELRKLRAPWIKTHA